MTDPSATPAGWYPAPHADNEQRYWDGTQWLDGPPVPAQPVIVAASGAGKPKRKLKWWQWGLIVLGALVLIGGIGNALGAGGNPTSAPSAPTSAGNDTEAAEASEEAEPEPEPEPVMVDIPELAGTTAGEAAAALRAIGLEPQQSNEDDADVIGTSPAAGEAVEEGSVVEIIAEDQPELSLGQQNAVSKAEDYLNYSAFSRKGLIEQLEFEGFSAKEAEFAVDYLEVDWNEQAAVKAQDYLDYSSFSRQGLIDQLMFEGFTEKQARYGVKKVGF